MQPEARFPLQNERSGSLTFGMFERWFHDVQVLLRSPQDFATVRHRVTARVTSARTSGASLASRRK
jgi:hypothetical protein